MVRPSKVEILSLIVLNKPIQLGFLLTSHPLGWLSRVFVAKHLYKPEIRSQILLPFFTFNFRWLLIDIRKSLFVLPTHLAWEKLQLIEFKDIATRSKRLLLIPESCTLYLKMSSESVFRVTFEASKPIMDRAPAYCLCHVRSP